jgi:hypothetical protein
MIGISLDEHTASHELTMCPQERRTTEADPDVPTPKRAKMDCAKLQ